MRDDVWLNRNMTVAWDALPFLHCVVDVSLSLAPGGLYWTLALAETMPVWLPQGHWTLVDSAEMYRSEAPVRLHLGGAPGRAGSEAFARSANEWHDTRDALKLEGQRNLFWIQSSWADSVVPKDNDPELIARHDALASGLEALVGEGPDAEALSGGKGLLDLAAISARGGASRRTRHADILSDCGRDALAIAAALSGPRPVLLAAMAKGSERPRLVDRLLSARVPCERLDEGPLREAIRRRLLPVLLSSGLAAPITAAGMHLAALVVVAPRARAVRSEDALEWNAAAAAAAKAAWGGASAIWCEVP